MTNFLFILEFMGGLISLFAIGWLVGWLVIYSDWICIINGVKITEQK